MKKIDLEEVLDIETNSFGKHHWSRETFESEINSDYSRYLIAEVINQTNKVIGYIGYWKVGNEGHITTLAVDEKYRRKHVADILLYNLINTAIKDSVIWLTLEVRATNIPAINLYKRFLFKQIGIRKKYYQDNKEDALILWTEKINDESFLNNLNTLYSNIVGKSINTDKYQYINI